MSNDKYAIPARGTNSGSGGNKKKIDILEHPLDGIAEESVYNEKSIAIIRNGWCIA